MSLTIPLKQLRQADLPRVGGKAVALARMGKAGLNVPTGISITTDAYRAYVEATGLNERILMELNRKDFKDMRWEELWDASLRIRNMFLRTPPPSELAAAIRCALEKPFSQEPVVVRSSAPSEDSGTASFAGLHESYVNVRGIDSILEHVRLVWASLWSDAALLYRQELGLDVTQSMMAVLIQEIVAGDRSGVAFGRSPNDAGKAVVEAVHGLNQGLVDGTIEPDRWIIDRASRRILLHTPAQRARRVIAASAGTRLERLPEPLRMRVPLQKAEVRRVFALTQKAERLFGRPQDVEWTFRSRHLYALQSRPITTSVQKDGPGKRSWYLSLRRSLENLKVLREKIEHELLPAMDAQAESLASENLAELSDVKLANKIVQRLRIHRKWTAVYWRDFIPFAHGARLFGQVYNDALRPADPHEFIELLRSNESIAMRRNEGLQLLAGRIRSDSLRTRCISKTAPLPKDFIAELDRFLDEYGDPAVLTGTRSDARTQFIQLLLQMAQSQRRRPKTRNTARLVKRFMARFSGEERGRAMELLELARVSYRLRDDDNVHLGRIESAAIAATSAGRERLTRAGRAGADAASPSDVASMLRSPGFAPKAQARAVMTEQPFKLQARQITGQPAGPGVAVGRARVILRREDLFDFKVGEILVCDAIDPNMTFVVPLAAAIVERRGGMLIHGAIIAREYGLPCVTGIPNATSLIRTGDWLNVDGYLGIVTISQARCSD